MQGLNKAYLIGHIGRDPEARVTASGLDVAIVALATPRSVKQADGWVDTTDWHRLTAFGKNAQYLVKYAKKGGSMAVECTLRPNRWTDKNNITHHDMTIRIERVLWLTNKGDAAVGEPPTDTHEGPEEE